VKLKQIKDALFAHMDSSTDDEIAGGITIAVTDPDTGTVYGLDTDGVSVQQVLATIDSACAPFDLFHPDIQPPEPAMTKSTAGLPKGNIYWKQVTKDDDVEAGKGVFIVTQKGKKYVANWSSNDAQKAQQFLLQQSNKRAE